VRGLTDAEIDALHTALVKLARPAFDEYVMKTVLDESEEKHWAVDAMAQAKANAQNSAKVLQENLFT
jgi:hypothetical protein